MSNTQNDNSHEIHREPSDSELVNAPVLNLERRIAYYETYRRMGGVAIAEFENLLSAPSHGALGPA